MRFSELRRVLQHVVLAGLPLTSGCLLAPDLFAGGDDDCVHQESRQLTLTTPADPALQLKIDSCRVDVDACRALCVMAMERAQLGSSNPSTCEVGFAGDAVEIEVTFDVYTDGPSCPVEGRRPAGLAAPRGGHAVSAAGAWLAHAAWLEAASVYAFVHLARELELHGAPQRLVRWALASARDEVAHTELVTRLARRHGARVPVPDIVPPAARDLAAIALENAVEGCVRETWGAVLALWQARAAADPIVRATFARIAEDEIRHAALAWEIDRWISARLDAETRARIVDARAAAVRELAAGAHDVQHAVATILGLPDREAARGLLARASDLVWSQGGVA